MARDLSWIVWIVLSATGACWPGRFVRTMVPRTPNLGLREMLMFSESPWRVSTWTLLALYCFEMTPCIASNTGPVAFDVEPG